MRRPSCWRRMLPSVPGHAKGYDLAECVNCVLCALPLAGVGEVLLHRDLEVIQPALYTVYLGHGQH
jgi:hypothetical protein